MLLACVSAQAADDATPELRILLATPTATMVQRSPQINLLGTAPARCMPTIERVTLDGTDLSVELKSPTTGCDSQHPLPFNLRVDPTASAGVPILPGQIYHVRVYAMNGAASLLAFHLIDTGAPASAPTPENGFWWSEASAASGPMSAGSGASIELQDGQLAVGLFGFAESGAPTWYFGSTRPTGRVATVSLVQLANGDPMFAPTGSLPSAQAGPRLELEFLSPTHARAYLVRSEGGRDVQVRALTLARSRFATGPTGSAWSGQWVLVPDDNGAPRIFEFTEPSSQDAETFHLGDTDNNASLDCRLAIGTRHPEVCTLSVAATPIADFDQVGLDRLSGHGSNGARVRLLRVPR
ncbi:hypothetical protein GCM10009105_03440 [Dokdonella soli]|uniref:Uncharacterized protein n=1 Tax=Dokdonella soli TaxID=529810 RepID=A0ABP3TI39_9GAMM